MSVWSFDTIPFYWKPRDQGGLPVKADWKSPPKLVKHPLAGSKSTVVAHVGYEPTEITGEIWFESATLLSKNGYSGTISDGTSNWTAILLLDAAKIVTDEDGYAGTATFTRASVIA